MVGEMDICGDIFVVFVIAFVSLDMTKHIICFSYMIFARNMLMESHRFSFFPWGKRKRNHFTECLTSFTTLPCLPFTDSGPPQ